VTATWLGADGVPLGPAVTLGGGEVRALPPARTAAPALSHPVTAALGSPATVKLLGGDLAEQAAPGAALPITLAWRAGSVPDRAYTVLLHLVDGEGRLLAQADGPPERPTTSWRAGEVIVDERVLALPADLPPGDYRLLAGLYDAADPAYPRLPVVLDGEQREDGRVPLGGLQVRP
jgi:hypothetical protein